MATNFVAILKTKTQKTKMHGYKKPKIDWSKKKSQRSNKGGWSDAFEDKQSKRARRNWRNSANDAENSENDDFYDNEDYDEEFKGNE